MTTAHRDCIRRDGYGGEYGWYDGRSEVAAVSEGPVERTASVLQNLLSGTAERAVQVGHADHVTIYDRQPESRENAVSPGVPLDQCSPYDLEVHRAMDAVGPGPSDESPPAYVQRAHDARLRAAVAAVARGHNVIMVLVGGSSTGKTRACWEAVRPRAAGEPGGLPPGWRLWHPINPGRPEAVLTDLDRIAPRTVLWLNETHHYLLTPGSAAGERVAAGLRELLRDPARGPILVLGTLWPEYWNVLVHVPASGAEDPHAQARDLLAGSSATVPDAFTEGDLRTAADSGDNRLVDAIEHARNGQITQYLAGAPALLERYRNLPAPPRALLTAAMDARRLGHGLFLSPDLLAAAASGYLTDAQWTHLPDEWLPAALRDACAVVPGGWSPLIRVRPRPGQTLSAGRTLRLEDYLEQTGRRTRATVSPPADLWHVLLADAPQEDCGALGAAAEQRGLYRLAFQFYRRAGTNEATQRGGRLLERCGRIDEALDHYRRFADSGDPTVVRLAGAGIDRLGRSDEALTLLRRAGEAGDPVALRLAAEHMITDGRTADAMAWLQARAEASDSAANTMLQDLRAAASRWQAGKADNGDPEPAPESMLSSNPDPQFHRLLEEAEELAKSDPDRAIAVYQQVIEATLAAESGGDMPAEWTEASEQPYWKVVGIEWTEVSDQLYWKRVGSRAWSGIVERFREPGHIEEGLRWIAPLAERGFQAAMSAYAELLEFTRDTSAAIDWYRRMAETDTSLSVAIENAVRLLCGDGRNDEALTWLATLADNGGKEARFIWADLLGRTGQVDKAIGIYQQEVAAGDRNALRSAMNLAVETDRWAAVGGWIEQRINSGDTVVRKVFADILASSGRADKAITLLKTLATAGDAEAARRLVKLLDETGRLDDAIDWLTGHPGRDSNTTLREVAELLESRGRVDDAIVVYQQLAEAGQTHGLIRGVRLAEQRGRATTMITWLRTRVDAGDTTALRLVAELCEQSGRIDDAIDWYRRTTLSGNASGLDHVARLLERLDRAAEAHRVRQFGLEQDGSTSDPWSGA